MFEMESIKLGICKWRDLGKMLSTIWMCILAMCIGLCLLCLTGVPREVDVLRTFFGERGFDNRFWKKKSVEVVT